MSKIAWCVMKNKPKRKVKIDDVTDELLNDPELIGFYCVGVTYDTGDSCGVKVMPIRNGLRKGFRVWSKLHHKKLCNKDRANAVLLKKRFDKWGQKTNIQMLHKQFKEWKHYENVNYKKDEGGKIDCIGESKYADVYDENRTIKRGITTRISLKKLCEVFVVCDPDEMFADERVGDIFIARDSIENVRKKGLAEGQVAIIICRRTKNREKIAPNAPKRYVVLQDAYAYDKDIKGKPLTLIVDCSEEVKQKLIKNDDNNNLLVICGEWKSDLADIGAYFCECNNVAQVFRATEDFFE